ncbi:RCC1 domain-containing protein 1 [Araneus ventricosus]|uniref:RCC1 domain-containing protein 1 n=1 Tax=Araneus ventricosus TaxID=182803 RepID=A0A4Y2SNQ6_ARAVE|nr:RCC1 domain-containing protein 1 [Araneus ventricosus]
MDNLFIYFGVKIFTNQDVHLLISNIEKDSNTQCFSHLQIPSKSLVHDVFLGWINLIFKTDGAFYHIRYCRSESEKHINEIFSSLKHLEIRDVSVGLNCTFLTTKDGRCHLFSNKNFLSEPLDLLPSICRIKNVVTEDLHSVVLTEDGKVFNFKCGEKTYLEKLVVPVPIKEITCGKEHVLLLSDFGTVFSYGSGSRGQLGHGSIENQETPVLIEALDGLKIQSISAGGWHSAAISDSGDLYMWGWNESGQLGLPCNELQNGKRPMEEIEIICCLPKIIELNDEVVKAVCCGSRHTVALTEYNHLWTWGWNGYFQLGRDDVPLSDKPGMVQLPSSFQPLQIKAKFWSTLVIGCSKHEKDTSCT